MVVQKMEERFREQWLQRKLLAGLLALQSTCYGSTSPAKCCVTPFFSIFCVPQALFVTLRSSLNAAIF